MILRGIKIFLEGGEKVNFMVEYNNFLYFCLKISR